MSSPSGVQLVPHGKNVLVFRNGDPFHHGRRMVVNEKQFITFEAFLNEVTTCIQAPTAVRSIYTPRNGHRVTELSDLLNRGQYVAAGTEKFRKLDIFRNGDLMTPPIRVLIPLSIMREWELVLTLLTEKANLYNGAVRKLCTLDGVSISCGSELVSGEYYVAIGSEKYKCLPYEEFLSPPGRNKNQPGVKRRIPKVGGKVYSVSQDGISDSALNSSPTQEDNRRIYSTGANFSGVKHTDGENSIFYAKPVRVRPTQRQKTNEMETKADGVYKVKETRHELDGAQEVKEDAHTRVEVPIDQREAEIVPEENIHVKTGTQPK